MTRKHVNEPYLFGSDTQEKRQRRKRHINAKANSGTHDKIWSEAYYLIEAGMRTVRQKGETLASMSSQNTSHNI